MERKIISYVGPPSRMVLGKSVFQRRPYQAEVSIMDFSVNKKADGKISCVWMRVSFSRKPEMFLVTSYWVSGLRFCDNISWSPGNKNLVLLSWGRVLEFSRILQSSWKTCVHGGSDGCCFQ